jgi:MoaA/NifB/PqqE/SkfB family radical SAM enzyme
VVSQADYAPVFNRSINGFFRRGVRLSLKDPSLALFLCQTVVRQKTAERVRSHWESRGLHVPPMLAISITRRCNLHCQGCYARAQHQSFEHEMSATRLHKVIAEAQDLGVSIIAILGGEPLTRPEILSITEDFPRIMFPFLTNGSLITEKTVNRFKRQKNLLPVISLEGYQAQTDDRRGRGVYGHALRAMKLMKEQGVLFGTSITLTRRNFDTVMNEEFVRQLINTGCRLIGLVDYVPVQAGTDELMLTDQQVQRKAALMTYFWKKFPSLFVSFPGDEEEVGGCLAAGRGFAHISPEGHLEPCPFAPFSDASLKDLSLKEALRSDFLQAIRENEGKLHESHGGCALWENREWVNSLLQSEGDQAA